MNKEVKVFSQRTPETKISREIKILAEIEKLWIMYDEDKSGTLDFDEVLDYLNTRAYPHLALSLEQIQNIWDSIDTDGNGTIDKKEMEAFLH